MSPSDHTRSGDPEAGDWDDQWDDADDWDDDPEAEWDDDEAWDDVPAAAVDDPDGEEWADDVDGGEELHPDDEGWDEPALGARRRRRLGAEYEELRPQSTRSRRVALVLLVIAGLVVLLLGGAAWWVRGQLDPSGSAGTEVAVAIPTGSSNGAIADILEDEGVIADAQVFRWYLRYKGAGDFQAGSFTFQQDMAAWDALAVLRAGPEAPPVLQFTVPEGLTLAQMVSAIAEDVPGFEAQVLLDVIASGQAKPAALPADASSLEGFLFPDTYQLPEGASEVAALQAMAAQFDAVAAEVGLAGAPDAVGLSPYEAVVVASLIQEEAANDAEMPQVARVIYNRIDEGMRLEIDAALCYGLDKPCGEITRSDLESDNPYNLRQVDGLPPTPIALPGRAALAAALAPADGPWLYYVLDPQVPDGGHLFTDDYDEFLAAKDRCEAAGLGCG